MSSKAPTRPGRPDDEEVANSATIEAPSGPLDPTMPAAAIGDETLPSVQELAGQTLGDGRYTVLGMLGRGGMSVVYTARHELLKKKVAIKVLRQELAASKEAMARFHREAMAAASIGDPHIIDITDYGFTDDGDAFIVMEHLDGLNLRATVAKDGALPAERCTAIAIQILQGLSAAHEQGIIHRDLKGENVFITQRKGTDFVKLLDFGISKVLGSLGGADETGLTSSGVVLGTPQYLAPEQAQGDGDVDHRVDIYAMGVILYEMLTGQLPFTGKNVLEMLMKHVQEAPRPPREVRPELDIPVELEAVALKALSKDREHRYASAEQMRAALEGVMSGVAAMAQTPTPTVAVAKPRGSLRHALTIGAVLVALGGAMVYLSRPAKAPSVETTADAVVVMPAPAPDAAVDTQPIVTSQPTKPDAAVETAPSPRETKKRVGRVRQARTKRTKPTGKTKPKVPEQVPKKVRKGPDKLTNPYD